VSLSSGTFHFTACNKQLYSKTLACGGGIPVRTSLRRCDLRIPCFAMEILTTLVGIHRDEGGEQLQKAIEQCSAHQHTPILIGVWHTTALRELKRGGYGDCLTLFIASTGFCFRHGEHQGAPIGRGYSTRHTGPLLSASIVTPWPTEATQCL